MSKKTKSKPNMKPVIIGFLSIVLVSLFLMMIKYKMDYDEFAKNNTFALEKKWKKVNHNWPEPPEKMKTYTEDGFYFFKYKYDGQEFWIKASDSNKVNSRTIYKYDTSTPSEINDDSKIIVISGNTDKYINDYMKGIANRIN